jgi:hypothetical protein
MGMDIDMKETDNSTDSRRLTKTSLNSAIRHLQKAIRKGAASNEYMHESVSFLEARGRRELHKDVSRINAKN